jgi:hypothetical protein
MKEMCQIIVTNTCTIAIYSVLIVHISEFAHFKLSFKSPFSILNIRTSSFNLVDQCTFFLILIRFDILF